jgi:tRNA(Ile)-lysidine synthase
LERNRTAQLARSQPHLGLGTALSLSAQLQAHLQQHQLLPQQSRILIAVSGGQDSLCLGQLLVNLQPRWQWQLAVGHCDHGWPADDGIADRVREVAQTWQLPYYCWNAQNLPQTDSAARHWRYQALIAMARTRSYQYVVTGHTQSDLAETLLYNLMRGAGSAGLSSLRPSRWLAADLQLVRPILSIDRQATGQFCHQHQLPVWLDVYNDQPHYARNRVRQNIAELSAQFHPQVTAHFAQTAQILAAESDYLQELAIAQYQSALVAPEKLDRQIIAALPLALQRRVIKLFLQNYDPSFSSIEEIVKLLMAPHNHRSSSLRGGITVAVVYQQLHIQTQKRV